MAVDAGHPAQRAGPEANPGDRARLGHDQPDRHGQRLRHHRQRRRAPRLVRGQEGDPRHRRQGALPRAAARPTGRCPTTSTATSATRCSRSSQDGTGQNALGARPPGRRQDRHGDQRRRRRLLVVVRRLHPAGRDRGDVRPRQGQRGAQRLPADASSARTTRPAPGRAVMQRRARGRRVGDFPPAGERRRRGARPTGHAPYTPPPSRPSPSRSPRSRRRRRRRRARAAAARPAATPAQPGAGRRRRRPAAPTRATRGERASPTDPTCTPVTTRRRTEPDGRRADARRPVRARR